MRMRCLLIILCCVLASTAYCCPTGCLCTRKKTDCRRKDFTSIPNDVPFTTEQLLLNGNKIDTLKHLYSGGSKSLAQLHILDLAHNQLSSIPDYAFDHFRSLRELYLDHNKIEIHSHNYPFDAVSYHLEKLSLSNNKISGPVEDHLFFYIGTLLHLNLSQNSLSSFNSTSFPVNLRILDLSFNDFKTTSSYSFGNHPDLIYFDFRGQKFKHFQGGTFQELDNLQELKLGGKYLETVSETLLSGLVKLKNLSIVDSRITDLPSSLFSKTNNLDKLDLSNNQLVTVHASIFNSTIYLKTLSLNRNRISNLDNLTSALEHVNITDLNLSFNFIRNSTSSFITSLHSMIRLNLSHNLIERLDGNAYSKTLQEIDLSSNQIAHIKQKFFDGCKTLLKVDLSRNKLLALPELDVSLSTQIFIAKNTWNCTCKLYKSFRQHQIRHKPKNLRCSAETNLSCLRCTFPERLNNTPVNALRENCVPKQSNPSNGYITTVYVGIALLFFLIILVGCIVVNKNYFVRLIRKTGQTTTTASYKCNNNCTANSELNSFSSRTVFVTQLDLIPNPITPDPLQSSGNHVANDSVYIETSTYPTSGNYSDSDRLRMTKESVSSYRIADENANSIERKADLPNQQSLFYGTYPRANRNSTILNETFFNNSNASMQSLPSDFHNVL